MHALGELVLDTVSVVHVHADPDMARERSGFRIARGASVHHPTIRPVVASEPEIEGEAMVDRQTTSGDAVAAIHVLGMNRPSPAVSRKVFWRETGEPRNCRADPTPRAIRRADPEKKCRRFKEETHIRPIDVPLFAITCTRRSTRVHTMFIRVCTHLTKRVGATSMPTVHPPTRRACSTPRRRNRQRLQNLQQMFSAGRVRVQGVMRRSQVKPRYRIAVLGRNTRWTTARRCGFGLQIGVANLRILGL